MHRRCQGLRRRQGDRPPGSGRAGSRALLIGLIAALLVAGVVVLVVVLTTGGQDPLAPGSGRATITWRSVGSNGPESAPQPFGGTIDGVPVSGVATPDTSAFHPFGGSSTLSREIHLYEYTGSFDHRRFDLGLYIPNPAVTPLQGKEVEVAEVRGTYGRQPVGADIVAPISAPSTTASFRGTVGSLRVSGTLSKPTRSGAENTATATFTVTK